MRTELQAFDTVDAGGVITSVIAARIFVVVLLLSLPESSAVEFVGMRGRRGFPVLRRSLRSLTAVFR